ncbi:hypothetical protein LTR27_010302 [Elasticomyces elasticus]|nr:hypothetical protein LTR27_010302 [Elasticomyces elasticus]
MALRTSTVPTGMVAPSAAKARRIRTTDSLHYDQPPPTQIETLRRRVYEHVVQRLQNMQIIVSGLSPQILNFLLPSGVSSAEYWQRLLEYPLFLTDVEMASIMRLEQSTPSTPNPLQGSHLYYVRSFRLTIGELLAIIADWEAKEIFFEFYEECQAWKRATEFVQDQSEEVYIRYIGMSTTVSAWSRFARDLAERKNGFYSAWLEALMKHCPHVIQTCNVYSFPQATTKAFRGSQGQLLALDVAHTDIREQALIALFGREFLLNRQGGGKHTSYQPPENDIALFQKLGVKAFSTLEQLSSTTDYHEPTSEMQSAVSSWIHSVCDLGMANPDALGTDVIPVTDSMEIAWAQQAMPASYYGHTIVVMIGDYCPLAGMYQPAPFWSQTDIQAVRYLKDSLARLKAYEQDRTDWNPGHLNSVVNDGALPWIDYQYTPRRKLFRKESAELMRQFLGTTQPLIAVTYERRTSGVVRANFVGLWSGHDFLPIVGEPDIQYWTHAGDVTGLGNKSKAAEFKPNPQDCFVQIPSIHPGSDKYASKPPEARRVFDMTMWQVDACIHIALDILQQGWSGTRAELCDEILTSFQKLWDRSGCGAEFDKAKQELASFYAAQPSRWSKDPKRAFRKAIDGEEVAVNLSGVVSVYWTKPDGKTTARITIAGGRSTNVHPPKGATGKEAIRTIHFLSSGIDIRDSDGNSCTYTRFKRSTTNPTFPGDVIRSKLEEKGTEDIVELWELETGLVFDDTFPEGSAMSGSACTNCAKNRDVCGGKIPCPRCVRMKLECKPQIMPTKPAAGKASSSKTGAGRKSPEKGGQKSPDKGGRKSPPKKDAPAAKKPSAGPSTGASLARVPELPSPGAASAGPTLPPATPGPPRTYASPYASRTPAQPRASQTFGPPRSSQGLAPSRPSLASAPRGQAQTFAPPAPPPVSGDPVPKGTGKRRRQISIREKCRRCRLGGMECDQERPCQKCAARGVECED